MTDTLKNLDNLNKTEENKKNNEINKMSNIEFLDKLNIHILNSYDIFNEKVNDDSVDVSNYLKFIIEHAEKKTR